MVNALSPLWQDRERLLQLIDRWTERGWLRTLDRAFVCLLARLDQEASAGLLLAAAFTSHQLGRGHVCLDLAATLAEPDFALSLPPEGDDSRDLPLPSQLLGDLSLDEWLGSLNGGLVAREEAAAEQDDRPLLLSDGRLYLRRYWCYECRVAAAIGQRLTQPVNIPPELSHWLDKLFAYSESGTDWQKLACALAAAGNFTLITGGPGTGKTTTVVRLLGVLQALAVAAGKPLRIRLAAPTGKAAMRLSESIARQVAALPLDEDVRRLIPSEVSTLHRLLGSRPDSRRFRHDRQHPLALDMLVVDEASMIDLEMMACLLDALPLTSRLVLLGDKDQLASVEAGAVMGDLCRDADLGYYSPALQSWLAGINGEMIKAERTGDARHYPLAQRTVMLRYSRRFAGDSGIGRLAYLVNRQQARQAREVLQQQSGQLHYQCLRQASDTTFEQLFVEGLPGRQDAPLGYRHYLECLERHRPVAAPPGDDRWPAWAAHILVAFERFRLLCVVRQGMWGVTGLNRRIEDALSREGLLQPLSDWYEGRPVMVTRNDYGLGLMNGDIGIALKIAVPDDGGAARQALRVAFARNDRAGEIRFVLPSRLTDVETVFAMTVHKSQGSEFDHTALVLPDKLSPVLSKELLYTAITRARRHFSLIESRAGVFEQAVQRQVRRCSGLVARLQREVSQDVSCGQTADHRQD